MLILRTYALYERNKRVLGLMVFVSLGVIGTSAVRPLASSMHSPRLISKLIPVVYHRGSRCKARRRGNSA